MTKRVHVAGIFVSCMSSVPRAFVRMPNSRAALTTHAKLFTFTRVKRVYARVHTHACVKFKVSGTVCKEPLQISTTNLVAFGGHKLNTSGKAHIQCTYKGHCYDVEFEVIRRSGCP